MTQGQQQDSRETHCASTAWTASVALKMALQRIRAFVRQHPFVTGLVGTFLFIRLLSFGWSWILTPTVNPNPKDPITISGTFPFDRGLELVFEQSAQTTTPWVNRRCGIFISEVGVPCRGGNVEVRPKQVNTKHYEVTFFRDYYLPGIAGWKHSGFGYRVQIAGSSSKLMSGLGSRFSEIRCLSVPSSEGRFTCIHTFDAGPSIRNKDDRYFKLNFSVDVEKLK